MSIFFHHYIPVLIPNIPPVYPHHISPSYIPIIYHHDIIIISPYYIYIYMSPVYPSIYTHYILGVYRLDPHYIPIIYPHYIYIYVYVYSHYILIISSLYRHYTCSLYIPEDISLEQTTPLIDFHSRFCKLCHISYIPSLGLMTRVLTGMNHQVL